jgi:glycerophosphoryl diester phosphodiesterase
MKLDIQGHRGCRGLMPENTIPAFKRALEIGVTTLEMDLVISADHQVVVSHDPYFEHTISMMPNGKPISAEEEKNHNIYRLNYQEIKAYDVGSKPVEKFPDQEKIRVCKPLFKDVVSTADEYAVHLNRALPLFNIEIKRKIEWDTLFHPDVETFVDLVLEVVNLLGIQNRVTIQSFDLESLKLVREKQAEIKLSLLIANLLTPQQNIDNLGFVPEIYSPAYQLVIQALRDYCSDQGMSLLPWTVNAEDDLKKMIDLNVDGIITDFPGRLVSLIKNS